MTTNERDWLAERFEEKRTHLRGVAYRMLGSLSEAEDAVQESWIRLSRTNADEIENLGGWLTTVVARVCLDMLRARQSRREQDFGPRGPDAMPRHGEGDPEDEAVLADSVGLALLVVLETLEPAERLAFVLHDMFAMPFDDIAGIVGRSPDATRQLASRARRRVQGKRTVPEPVLMRHRKIVQEFRDAARRHDFDALVRILAPDVFSHGDGPAAREARGPETVARRALLFSHRAPFTGLALIDGVVGAVYAPHGHLETAMRFTIVDDLITEIEVITSPERLARLEIAVLEE